jgi:hypothetical protein
MAPVRRIPVSTTDQSLYRVMLIKICSFSMEKTMKDHAGKSLIEDAVMILVKRNKST